MKRLVRHRHFDMVIAQRGGGLNTDSGFSTDMLRHLGNDASITTEHIQSHISNCVIANDLG